MEPIIVVGLGNPGTEYEGTRHNVGFSVVESLARKWKMQYRSGLGEYLFARGDIGGTPVVLAKPLTYMNNSGIAVTDVLARHGAPQSSLLVVADDLALPLGTLRIRPGGSDGGHNGLYSIIYQLQSDEFARLRCGIGRMDNPPGEILADFVLSRFDADEVEQCAAMIGRAADAVTEFVLSGIGSAMNRFNT